MPHCPQYRGNGAKTRIAGYGSLGAAMRELNKSQRRITLPKTSKYKRGRVGVCILRRPEIWAEADDVQIAEYLDLVAMLQ